MRPASPSPTMLSREVMEASWVMREAAARRMEAVKPVGFGAGILGEVDVDCVEGVGTGTEEAEVGAGAGRAEDHFQPGTLGLSSRRVRRSERETGQASPGRGRRSNVREKPGMFNEVYMIVSMDKNQHKQGKPTINAPTRTLFTPIFRPLSCSTISLATPLISSSLIPPRLLTITTTSSFPEPGAPKGRKERSGSMVDVRRSRRVEMRSLRGGIGEICSKPGSLWIPIPISAEVGERWEDAGVVPGI